MNIFRKEWKSYRKSLLFWCLGIFVLLAGGMSKYAAISSTGQSMTELMSKMPKSLQIVLGTGSFDLTKAIGYYGVLFVYLALMATIHASMLGAGIISKEERDKTSEFLMVKPITRHAVITSKLLAAFANIVFLNMFTLVASFGLVGHYSGGEPVNGKIAVMMVGMLMLQLIFLVIGTSIAAASKRPKHAATVSAGVLFVTYVLSLLIDLSEKLEKLKYVTPFKYFEAKHVLADGSLDRVYVELSVVIIASLLRATYHFYAKRDLRV